MDEDRLVKIETKIAFQEQTIKDLNEVIYAQQKEIERLGAIFDALMKQGRELSQSAPGNTAPADEKPPHY